jgi:pimeloyl-ACP methyl ester carboxylesterase
MRLPTPHTSQPWRIHQIAPDFRLEDVWELPGRGGPDDFPRVVQLLATTVLGDAACGLSALLADERIDGAKLGAMGHSYGGYVTILLAALDERVRFACASGSACSYKRRMLDRSGIEFSQAIPGILNLVDIDGLVGLIAPRPLLLLSATEGATRLTLQRSCRRPWVPGRLAARARSWSTSATRAATHSRQSAPKRSSGG